MYRTTGSIKKKVLAVLLFFLAIGISGFDFEKTGFSRHVISDGFGDTLIPVSTTDIGGNITIDTTWTLAGSPYTLTSTVVVNAGITLTVEPGVTVKGNANTQLRVMGRLVAVGTEGEPILFTSAQDTGPSQWQGLVFEGDQASGDLQYVTVRYGGYSSKSNITVRNVQTNQVLIAHSVVELELSAGYTDYGLYVENSRVVVSDSEFSGNGDPSQPWDYGIYATGAGTNLAVTNSLFDNNNGSGLFAAGLSTVSVTGCTFLNNVGWAMKVSIDALESLTQSGNITTGNRQDRLVISDGAMVHDMDLGSVDLGGHTGYVLGSHLQVPAGLTLTVEPGALIMGETETKLNVMGRLVAVGTEGEPILFTSAQDTGPSQWQGLVFEGDQASGDLQYVTVRYGGYSSKSNITVRNVQTNQVLIAHSVVELELSAGYTDYGLYVENSRVVVSDSEFSGNGDPSQPWDYGIYATGAGTNLAVTNSLFDNNNGSGLFAAGLSTVSVTGCTFLNNVGWAMKVSIDALESLTQSGNITTGNRQDRLVISDGAMVHDMDLGSVDLGGHTGYVLGSHLQVPAGLTLTVEPGALIMGETETKLNVMGRLVAVGTEGEPILFTSAQDTGPSQWQGLVFEGDQASGDLQYVTVRYGGYSSKSNITVRNVQTNQVLIAHSVVELELSAGYTDYGLYVENSRVVVSDSEFSGNGDPSQPWDYGIYATGAGTNLAVTNSLFDNNNGSGLFAAGLSTVSVTGCTFLNNAVSGIRVQESKVTVENTSIFGNAVFGIENLSSTPIVQARYNWWGHPSGPYHQVNNVAGQGNQVSNYVTFDPWQVSPSTRQPLDLTLGQSISATLAQLSFADYHLATSAGKSLVVTISPLVGSSSLWVYSRLNDLPLWDDFDQRTQTKNINGTYELLVSPTQAGDYYFSIYGQDVADTGGNFQVQVKESGRYLSDITPRSAGNNGQVTLNLAGIPFEQGMRVELRKTGLPVLAADNLTLYSSTGLWAHFNLSSVATGVYDVIAVWPDESEASLGVAFTVIGGSGPHLELSISGPGPIRAGRQYVYTLSYTNTGDADMSAPFLYVSSPVPETLHYSNGWFATDRLIWLGSVLGMPGDVLAPGQGGEIPLIVSTNQDLDLIIGVLQEDVTAFDWASLESRLKPEGYPDAEWQTMWSSMIAQIGSTHQEVLNTLRLNSRNLSGFSDLDSLLRYSLFTAGQDAVLPVAGPQHSPSQNEYSGNSSSYDGSDVQVVPAPGTTFDPDKPTIVITHGWNLGGKDDFQRFNDLSQQAATAYGSNYNVVMVLWPEGANSINPRGASSNIPIAAQAAIDQLGIMGYSRWGETIYIGESFGNGINAWMSANADPGARGTGLILNSADPRGYPGGKEPDFKNDFKNSLSIQTWDIADAGKVGNRTLLLRNPDCGGTPCNLFGQSHTSGMRYITWLFSVNPDLARQLIECRWDILGLLDQGLGLFDGYLTWQGGLFTDYLEHLFYLLAEFGFGVNPLNYFNIALVRPSDPNEKVGPAGYGSDRLVQVNTPLEYTIYFENISSATAPAQEVFITDALDSGLDWSTFQVTGFAFGDQIIPVQEQGSQFYARYSVNDYRPEMFKTWWLDIYAQVNPLTGQASWIFRTLDPETGQLAQDPLAGFLPPNDETRRGEGHVSFTILPLASDPPGTILTNQASIIFDVNEAVLTNTVTNIIGTPPIWNVYLPLVVHSFTTSGGAPFLR